MHSQKLETRRTARTVLRVACRAAGWAALPVSCLILAGLALLPHLGLYRPVTVLSNSMEPAFGAGDLIVVTPQPLRELRKGHVIVYAAPLGDHHVVTHRVIRMVEGGDNPVIVTKGDANERVDPWQARLEGEIAWRHRLTIPRVGHALLFLRRPAVRRFSLYAAPAALALLCLTGIWRPGPRARRRFGAEAS